MSAADNEPGARLATSSLWPTAASAFLDANRHRIRTSDSRATYDKVLHGLQKRLPHKRLSQFTAADVLQYCSEPHLASATLLQRRTVLLRFFRWARKVEPTLANASLLDELADSEPPRRKPVRHGNWLTEAELAAVVDACDDGTPLGERDRMVIVLLAWTGMRRSELASLRWGDVDLDGCALRVVGKGEKLAEIGFNPRLRDLLADWRVKAAKGLGRPPSKDDPVIPRLRMVSHVPGSTEFHYIVVWDTPAGRHAIYKAVQRRGQLAGLARTQHLAPHDLRRTFAGLLERNSDLLSVSKALRHNSVATTQAYLDSRPDRGREVGQAFDLDIAL